ncbi:hypothetical protein SAMN05660649_04138 [Desulfotomaculum arcticum]|uniref:Uncharacterized protein n=2 Tax=Desulfotruncus TaxID=2867377 RepID=A0A1I2XVB3_9FIRM|nr:hypothetical protein SAMN05660649_04138 [Desulfotomaculum arcticum] [Desulfotruncus arcticus DSM 17038]
MLKSLFEVTLMNIEAIIEKNKEEIYKLKQQLEATSDSREKRILKRRLAQLQIEQLKYLNKLG